MSSERKKPAEGRANGSQAAIQSYRTRSMEGRAVRNRGRCQSCRISYVLMIMSMSQCATRVASTRPIGQCDIKLDRDGLVDEHLGKDLIGGAGGCEQGGRISMCDLH